MFSMYGLRRLEINGCFGIEDNSFDAFYLLIHVYWNKFILVVRKFVVMDVR